MITLVVAVIVLLLMVASGIASWIFRKFVHEAQICYLNDIAWLAGLIWPIFVYTAALAVIAIWAPWWHVLVALVLWGWPVYGMLGKELWGARPELKWIIKDTKMYWNKPDFWTA